MATLPSYAMSWFRANTPQQGQQGTGVPGGNPNPQYQVQTPQASQQGQAPQSGQSPFQNPGTVDMDLLPKIGQVASIFGLGSPVPVQQPGWSGPQVTNVGTGQLGKNPNTGGNFFPAGFVNAQGLNGYAAPAEWFFSSPTNDPVKRLSAYLMGSPLLANNPLWQPTLTPSLLASLQQAGYKKS